MGLPGRSTTCTPRKLLNAISRMRCDHKRYGGTVMFFPDLSHQVMLCAMSGMSESSESSESSGSVRALPTSRVITLLQSAWGNCFSSTPSLLPAALARASLVLRQLEPPPESTWGSPPHPPGRSRTCTPRKLLNAISRMRGDHKRYGGTVGIFHFARQGFLPPLYFTRKGLR